MGKSKQTKILCDKKESSKCKNNNWQTRSKRSKVINFNESNKLLYMTQNIVTLLMKKH